MKKPLIVLPVVSLLVFVIMSYGFGMKAAKKPHHAITQKGFAVVELFTSEGCSSCPPADEAVAALAKDYPSNVIVLGFHVDYWNYLGWKDAFSAADYSTRQQQYAAAFSLNSIYTPQVIVNGKTEFTGSEKSKLYSTVEKELNTAGATGIELSAKKINGAAVQVSYQANADSKDLVCIALVQLQAVSVVKKGENKGMMLHHIDVVRNFKTVNSNTGSLNIPIPAGLTDKDCKIVAFVQHKNNMHIIAAAETVIN